MAEATDQHKQVSPAVSGPTADVAAGGKLKLMARDAEDLKVVSAMLQDALVPLADFRFEKFEKRFIGVVNRFCWERPASQPDPDASQSPLYQRTLCGISIDGITRVQTRGIDTDNRSRPLNLLAIDADETGIVFVFSGEGVIRLESAAIEVTVGDLGEPWATPFRPNHPEAANAETTRPSFGDPAPHGPQAGWVEIDGSPGDAR